MERFMELVRGVADKKFGFRMDEVMSGTHVFETGAGPQGRHEFSFTVTWGPDDLVRWLDPRSGSFLTQDLDGTVTIGGLCEAAPCKGRLELRYFDEHVLRYRFEFEVRGVHYRYVGEKVNIQPWNLPVSHTTCFGVVTEADTGRLISRSVTHFRLRTVPAFLRSLRAA
ncbi:MAG: hypothetical protein HY905_04225 [Deltaproteobacteria bacterium]|nr:hypothetical protein [Deltaproteobacteria bacterium]